MDDNDPSDLTPTETPNAKKSSGEWKFTFNAAGAPCARCYCRRDEHATRNDGSHRWECRNCGVCAEFVAGGLPDYDTLRDTEKT